MYAPHLTPEQSLRCRVQVSIPPPSTGPSPVNDRLASAATVPMAIPETVLERDSKGDSFGEGSASPGIVAVSPNGIASPFATYQPPLVDVQ